MTLHMKYIWLFYLLDLRKNLFNFKILICSGEFRRASFKNKNYRFILTRVIRFLRSNYFVNACLVVTNRFADVINVNLLK